MAVAHEVERPLDDGHAIMMHMHVFTIRWIAPRIICLPSCGTLACWPTLRSMRDNLLPPYGNVNLSLYAARRIMQIYNWWLVGRGGMKGRWMDLKDSCNEGRLRDCFDPGETKSIKQWFEGVVRGNSDGAHTCSDGYQDGSSKGEGILSSSYAGIR